MHDLETHTQGVRVVPFASVLAGGGPGPARPGETLVVDLGAVAALDLTGLVALLRFLREARAAGAEVGLAALSGRARLAAQQMQLHRLVEIFNTAEEALRSRTPPPQQQPLPPAKSAV
jgi:ABC-type transporter Mla MlaB component